MGDKPIRVLVVDDSAVIREMIADLVAQHPDMELAGVACDGLEALRVFNQVQPDVVTLDLHMPRMDGLATLDALLARRPVPVIMVSSQTTAGADVTLEALERGAMDYVAKPDGAGGSSLALRHELMRKIRTMAGADLQRILEIRKRRAEQRRAQFQRAAADVAPPANDEAAPFQDKLIAIGVSTGGPPALTLLFEQLAPPLPPIVIVQHMPAHFTGEFARRLDSRSALQVKEAATGDVLLPNHAFVAPGGRHLLIRPGVRSGKLLVRDGEPVSGHKPSVDVMMQSAAELYGSRCLGVIMTGMGRDGSDGCRAIRSAGGFVLGQDEATSDVYGMNKVAMIEGNVDCQFPLDDVGPTIVRTIRRLWTRAAVGSQ